ncbi:MAG: toll/interleukin-1 receptor domain-containing protein [Bryobacteraceae bacterium]
MAVTLFDPTVALVHAAGDEPAARELAAFLERGMRARCLVEEARIRDGESLVEAVDRALSADKVAVLLSPRAVVRRGSGPEWDELAERLAEMESPVASIQLEACVAPARLRNRACFDGSRDRLHAFRTLKRWLLDPTRRPDPVLPAPPEERPAAEEIEELRARIADAPGQMLLPAGSPLAAEFVRRCGDDFEAIAWVDARWRSAENLIAEIGARVGLRLAGPLEDDGNRLAGEIAPLRILVAVENCEHAALLRPLLSPLASLLETEPAPAALPDPEAVLLTLRKWRADPAAALAVLPAAEALFAEYAESDYPIAAEIARLAFLLAKNEGRGAEAYRWMDVLEPAAAEDDDLATLAECQREKAWIESAWGEGGVIPTADESAQPFQLSLFD